MAWIRTVDEADVTGVVKEEYDAAFARAGQLYNIVKLFSVRPKSMHAFVELYKNCDARSGLSIESDATGNDCHCRLESKRMSLLNNRARR